jgi:hypothetical protein
MHSAMRVRKRKKLDLLSLDRTLVSTLVDIQTEAAPPNVRAYILSTNVFTIIWSIPYY